MIEFLKVIFLGIVEGITEWLPISSTGHMILVDEFIKLNVTPEFKNMFLVVIQLGAIMAVVVIFWKKIMPLKMNKAGKLHISKPIFDMWLKILVSCLPAAIIGILFDEFFEKHFYNPVSIAIALIVFGIFFIVVENARQGKEDRVTLLSQLTYKDAVIIGLFQVIAAIFPGTSRSGATIVGALMFGVSRYVATEFTFFLAIPVMFGASLLKLVGFGFNFTATEAGMLIVGMVTAFVVSIIAIKFLLVYIKKNDFKVFGWYRIILGVIVLAYFLLIK
ncbi:MAG TPA: undecaprenyl-diphosphate phosphatase [Erysipelothrix sp.]|nr:undecaprenyl-diphosphate phosphatase [Erysipelothrix sp.]